MSLFDPIASRDGPAGCDSPGELTFNQELILELAEEFGA
jgi:hypothetical protein